MDAVDAVAAPRGGTYADPLPEVRDAGRWLHPAEPEPDAGVRLFLLHHSGGGASMYRAWPAELGAAVACRAVQLPGRQERRREAPYTRLEPLVAALAKVVAQDWDGRPYAVFGHSMGALLGYRLTVELERRALPAPALLAVSGWAPTGFSAPAALSSDPLAALRLLGGLPAGVEADPELLAQAVRAMAADGAVCADHRDDGAVVGAPVVAYQGREDPLLAPGAMRAWSGRTAEFLGCRTFPGDHYYLRDHARALTADLSQSLSRYTATG
ncbi:thioesterase domain-containing protein [Streptomyces sp. NPDC087917]|uniref:thioesterase II family protein n=1 Tax=Streptomyces sp. NPDC087917 TaxID=3155060 RepID=UPI00341330F1